MATNDEAVKLFINNDTVNVEQQQEVPTPPIEDVIKSKLNLIDANIERDKLEKITITKEIFEQIRKSLQDTVKSMEKNPSIFSRAAEYWGELPLWQKIIGGVALTVPTLILGIVAHIGFLLAICGVTAVTYTAGGLILDDHHKCSSSAVESLQKGILGLADLLELTINALDIIRKQLAVEIEKFVKENARLTENIEALSHQIDEIDKQILATTKVNTALGETKDGLVKVSENLKEGVTQHGDFLKQNQEKLDRITQGYDASQKELSAKILEIQQVRKELGDDLERAKSMMDALSSTISQLSTTSFIGNEAQRKAFLEKLDILMSNKEASFLIVADRICESERRLAIVQKELENSNDRYQALLKIQEKHIDRLSTIPSIEHASVIELPLKTSAIDILNKIGILAKKKETEVNSSEQTAAPEFS